MLAQRRLNDMGFTGLARWVNAPTSGLELIRDNILSNHNGMQRSVWSISIKSYRSTLGKIPNLQIPAERSMCVLTMDENTFVLVDDPVAPSRTEVLAAAPPGQEALYLQGPPHYRSTFITVKPRNSIEQLLSQLRPRWTSVRSTPTAGTQGAQAGQQLAVEGYVFSIGSDWLVRAGNVTLVGGGVRGLLLEVEYLPCAALDSDGAATPELLSNLLTSLLPTRADDRILALTFGDEQWEELLWNREEEVGARLKPVAEKEEDDCYAHGYEEIGKAQPRDWVGVDRDRRSAYLIIGALRSEGML